MRDLRPTRADLGTALWVLWWIIAVIVAVLLVVAVVALIWWLVQIPGIIHQMEQGR